MNNQGNGAEETGAMALLDELAALGVEYIFGNLGTDYPAIIEAVAQREDDGVDTPRMLLTQHENIAIASAAGYAQVTGRPQAVFVHVDVGTANLGGMLHNVNRGHVGVFIFSGLSPWTTGGELPGSRSNPIQFLQDIPDQMSIVRPYVRWAYEAKTAKNIRQLVRRGYLLASGDLQAPVYLMAAREPLAELTEKATPSAKPTGAYRNVAPPAFLEELAAAIRSADNPLIVTTYLGRDPQAVETLVDIAEEWGVGVVESAADALSFDRTNDLYQGSDTVSALQNADVVVVIDCDVPWLPIRYQPSPDTVVFHLDADLDKDDISVISFDADHRVCANSGNSLMALRDMLKPFVSEDAERIASRRERWKQRAAAARQRLLDFPTKGPGLPPQVVASTVGRHLAADAIVIDDSISSQKFCSALTNRSLPRTYFTGGGSSLGWGLGAAIGAKLAAPDQDVVAMIADGSFVFGVPSAAFWGARKYDAPFLTVVFNNEGWEAVEIATRDQYRDGTAVRRGSFQSDLSEQVAFGELAHAAGGAWFAKAATEQALHEALEEGLEVVRGGRCAVIEVLVQRGA